MNTSESIKQYESNEPNGGLPPIYICRTQKDDMLINKNDGKTKREYETHKTTISIKSILDKRRQNTIHAVSNK